MLHVLRNGIRDRGISLKVAYFKPVSSLNYETRQNTMLMSLRVYVSLRIAQITIKRLIWCYRSMVFHSLH